jgi:hypothetical protein
MRVARDGEVYVTFSPKWWHLWRWLYWAWVFLFTSKKRGVVEFEHLAFVRRFQEESGSEVLSPVFRKIRVRVYEAR